MRAECPIASAGGVVPRRAAGHPPLAPLEEWPAEVGRLRPVERDQVELLEPRLADVRDHEAPPTTVDGDPPRNPQPAGDDLGDRLARARIQPDDLAGERGRVLARIGSGAEAEACVEEAVGAERRVASHVHATVARHREERPRAGRPRGPGETIQVDAPVLRV